MRHRAGSWKPACTAECPAGVITSPRPGHRVFHCIVAGIVAMHAAFIATQWQAALPQQAASARMSMRLVSAPVRKAEALRSPGATRDRAVTLKKSSKTQPVAQVRRFDAQTAPAPQEPITGIAFGPPRIGTPGGASASWMPRSPEPTPPAMTPPPAMLMQMQAARAAGIAQIADALRRELSAWEAPKDPGACAISTQPDERVVCDNETLMQMMSPREAVLAGLLRAYRSIEPQTRGLSIAVADGRYQVAWTTQ